MHSIIPLGQMSEEISEAKNKEIRRVRLGHTLKTSRHQTNYDLIKYMLMSSDTCIFIFASKNHKDLKFLLKNH